MSIGNPLIENSTPEGTPSPSRSPRAILLAWRWRLGMVLMLALIVAMTLPLMWLPLGRDQGVFAVIATEILDGGAPYADSWDIAAPGVYYVYAAAIAAFGETTIAIRSIDVIMLPLLGLALYWLGARLSNPRVGLWAALLLPTFYVRESFWNFTQKDGLAMLPLTLAVVCVVVAGDNRPGSVRSLLWLLLSGVLCGLAIWFKYPLVFVAAAFGTAHLLRRYTEGNRGAMLIESAFFIGGGVLMGLIGSIYVAAVGAFGELLLTLRAVSVGYSAPGLLTAEGRGRMLTFLDTRYRRWILLLLLVARFPFPDGAPRKREWNIVWMWALAGTLVVILQGRGFEYHWLPILPAMALMAADSVDRLLTAAAKLIYARRATLMHAVLAVGVGLFFVTQVTMPRTWGRVEGYTSGELSLLENQARFRVGDFLVVDSLRMANYLQNEASPDDTLFIFGFRPEVYYLSGMEPASRFIAHFPLVADGYPDDWLDEAASDVLENRPAYVLVMQDDPMPGITGSELDSYELLRERDPLTTVIVNNYTRLEDVGPFIVLIRNDL